MGFKDDILIFVKKLLLSILMSGMATIAAAAGCGQTVFNPFTGKLDCIGTPSSGGGGGSPLEVFSNFDGVKSSPTLSISLGDAIKLSVSGSTAIFNVDFSSVVSQSDLSLYMTQSSSTLNDLKLSSAAATYLNKLSPYVSSITVTNALRNLGSPTVPILGVNFSSVTTTAAGSNTNIQYNNSGSFGGDNGLQYDPSGSSVTANGNIGAHKNSNTVEMIPDNGSGDPQVIIDDSNGTPGGSFIFKENGVQVGKFGDSTSGFSIYFTTGGPSNIERMRFDRNTQKMKLLDGAGSTIVEFDMIGNSSFTTPIVLTALTSASSLATDSTGKIIAGSGTGGGGSSATSAGGIIYTSSSNVTQTGISTTPVVLSAFRTTGNATLVALSTTNSSIVVSTTAVFDFDANIISTGTGNFTQYFEFRVNGSTTGFTCPDTPSARCLMMGQKQLTFGDTVQIYTNVNLVGNSTITITDAQFRISAVGGAGGSGGGTSSGGGYALQPTTVTIQATQAGLIASTVTVISTTTLNGDQILFSPPYVQIYTYSADAGMCTLSSGCIDGVPFASTTSFTNYIGASFPYNTTSYWNIAIPLPPGYVSGSTFTATLVWTSTVATGNIAWNVQMKAVASGQTMDLPWGTSVQITDSITASGTEEKTAESSSITAANSPIGGSRLFVQVFRGVSGSDTLSGDALLEAIDIRVPKNKL